MPTSPTAPTANNPRDRASRLALARRDAYRLLAGLFLRPPPATLAGLADLAGALDATLGDVAPEVVAELTRALSEGPAAQHFTDDYRALLEVQTSRSLVPVESVYALAVFDGKAWQLGRLRSERWHRVRQRYAEGGLGIRDDLGIESDHLSCELEFLAHLCELEAQAWSRGDEAGTVAVRSQAAAFLREHPGSWIRRVRQRAADLAQTPLYRLAPLLVERFLAVEDAHLHGGG